MDCCAIKLEDLGPFVTWICFASVAAGTWGNDKFTYVTCLNTTKDKGLEAVKIQTWAATKWVVRCQDLVQQTIAHSAKARASKS